MSLFKIFIASYGTFLLLLQNVFAASDKSTTPAPLINCFGLPGCKDTNIANPTGAKIGGDNNNAAEFLIEIISMVLQYVSVVAVITLMISGVMYLLSGGEEEKVKKAKNWIIWSLIGVLVSISSWFLVSIINNIGTISGS